MVTTLVILQAAILGVLIGGGFWFRHVVNQQLRLKDSQNAVLRAERDQARTAAAPALAQEWMTTSKALDEMTGQKQKLQQDFDQFKTQVGKAGADATGPFYRGIGFGCLEGAMAIKHLFYDYYATKGTSLPTRFFQALVKEHNELT